MTEYYTAEARLLAKGWAPGEAIEAVVRSREALLAVLARLGAHVRDDAALAGAIQSSEVEAIAATLSSHAIGIYLDTQLQTASSAVTDWWAHFCNQLSALIAAAPQGLLDGLHGIEDAEGDSAAIRTEAAAYLDANSRLFGMHGTRPLTAPIQRVWQLLPRHIAPLSSTPPSGPSEADIAATNAAIASAGKGAAE